MSTDEDLRKPPMSPDEELRSYNPIYNPMFPEYPSYTPMFSEYLRRTPTSPDEDLIRTIPGTPFPCIQIFRDYALRKAKEENFVFSPCSIQLALSLITNGAASATLEVLLKFLEAENQEQLKSHASKLISALTESFTEGPKLSFVGGVWVDQSKKLTPNFKYDAETIYKAKAEETVNEWAAESTNGIIPSFLPEGSIDELTRVVLANALYFKGKWSDPFENERTKNLRFYRQGGGSVKVPFMSNSERQFIKTFDNLKVLKLPYSKSTLSMYILLPHKRDGLGPLVEEVSSNPLFFEKYTSVWKSVRVGKFGVPKFKINYTFEASEVLKAMGLELCYSNFADFGEMVVDGGIQVQKVYHGSYIEVEEEGTKAAACTSIRMGIMCCKSRPPPEIRIDFMADHPFMYVVKDDNSGMVLFMGHVVNPSLK
ncbi:hypothetical protein ACHQM5_010881 [Ranunculus cassubicifolius]